MSGSYNVWCVLVSSKLFSLRLQSFISDGANIAQWDTYVITKPQPSGTRPVHLHVSNLLCLREFCILLMFH